MTKKLALETIRIMLENACVFVNACNDHQTKLKGIKTMI